MGKMHTLIDNIDIKFHNEHIQKHHLQSTNAHTQTPLSIYKCTHKHHLKSTYAHTKTTYNLHIHIRTPLTIYICTHKHINACKAHTYTIRLATQYLKLIYVLLYLTYSSNNVQVTLYKYQITYLIYVRNDIGKIAMITNNIKMFFST